MEVKFSNFSIDHILDKSAEVTPHPYTDGGSSPAQRGDLYHSAQPAGLNGFCTYGMQIGIPVYQVSPQAYSFCSACCYSRPAPSNISTFSPGHSEAYAYETGSQTDQMCCPHAVNPRHRSRMRTVFTECQTKQLDHLFSMTDYPSVEARAELARNTGLTEETVRVWFKNRRARRKRQNTRVKSPESYSEDQEETHWDREETNGIQRMSNVL
ncbi:dharma [Alosa alosa]|uniref:dharma n=1 Tax=Alosa alosa TaxID=278164 RepID=UPI0020152BCC|nr:dharma [Alosa alosa]